MAFSASWLRRVGLQPDETLEMIANDDSLAPDIRRGDTLLVEPYLPPLKAGKVYVVRGPDGLVARRFDPLSGFMHSRGVDERLTPASDVIGRVVYRSGSF